jgi:hypothetical protein
MVCRLVEAGGQFFKSKFMCFRRLCDSLTNLSVYIHTAGSRKQTLQFNIALYHFYVNERNLFINYDVKRSVKLTRYRTISEHSQRTDVKTSDSFDVFISILTKLNPLKQV